MFKTRQQAPGKSVLLDLYLTRICCKITKHILHSHIINHLESTKILSELQQAFERGTQHDVRYHAIIDSSESINQYHSGYGWWHWLWKSDWHCTVLLNFSIAFDKVLHEGLINKCQQMVWRIRYWNGSLVSRKIACKRWFLMAKPFLHQR